MRKLSIILLTLLYSCGPTREEYEHSKEYSIGRLTNISVNNDCYIVSYYIDKYTGLCYATHAIHGFICVHCDSLKKLRK